MLEITITHQFDAQGVERLLREEAIALREKRWIGTGAEGHGPDPARYAEGNHQRQIVLFNRINTEGAAVVAAYPGISAEHDRYRLVGIVRPNTMSRHGRLICLPLTESHVYDASISFLGNLQPVQCTVQDCSKRSETRLATLASGKELPRSVASMHNKDVEWCCLNYMIAREECKTVWKGGHAFPRIDHVAWTADGHEILVQITVSKGKDVVRDKSTALAALTDPDRFLVMFAPAETRASCDKRVRFVPIEAAFDLLDGCASGKSFINRAVRAKRIDPPPF